ncbi:MAG: hypothetical protein ACLTSX_12455 [Collinsella sp.]
MAILNSKQLWAERNRLAEEQRKAADDRTRARRSSFRARSSSLTSPSAASSRRRTLSANAPKPKQHADSFGVRILGARDEFHGLQVGFKNSAEVGPRNAASVVTVGAPTEIELEIPPSSPARSELREHPDRDALRRLRHLQAARQGQRERRARYVGRRHRRHQRHQSAGHLRVEGRGGQQGDHRGLRAHLQGHADGLRRAS